VVGVQNGIEIYRVSLPVYDPPGGGFKRFAFPSYKPQTGGNIVWTVTLTDGNPDQDVSVKITEVKDEHDDDENDDHHDDHQFDHHGHHLDDY
jgi:hypothetical protein